MRVDGRASPTPTVYPLATGCRALDLEDWVARAEASEDADALARVLAEVGLPLVADEDADDWLLAPELVEIRRRTAQLSSDPGEEVILEVELRMQGADPWEEATRVAVQVLFANAHGEVCFAGSDLSADLQVELRACAEHPVDGSMEAPQVLDVVPLLERRFGAIRQRSQSGLCGGYPRMSLYETSFWVLRDGALAQVFGPFETYYETHSVVMDPEWHEGDVRLVGGFPRRIQTVHHVRCEPPEEVDPEDPPEPCVPATQRQTLRYDGTEYR